MSITVPYIVFVTTPYLITSFVGNITSFNIIYLLTGGAPIVPGGYKAGSTDLLVTWLYKLTIDENEYNLGSVIAIMTFIITATGTLLTYRKSKAYKDEEAFQ
jgi:arabinogalactan oligomer / maltooligosaccharide transport system permease protein